jgi:CIC family chloride channel protein
VDVTNDSGQTAGLNLQTLRRLKFWVWFQEWTRPSELQVTLIWAGIIGFCGAFCSIAYRVGTSFVHKILTGSSATGLVESFTELPVWGRLVVPAIGGLIAGAIIHLGARFHGQVTTTDYMEAVVLGDGRISARQSMVKSLSALFTNASGGSIGREGPLVQLAAMVASLAGRLQRWTTPRLRLLVACGAAAGIASSYNLQFPVRCLSPKSCLVPWRWKFSGRSCLHPLLPR